jgi:hypothetical protein
VLSPRTGRDYRQVVDQARLFSMKTQ